MSELLAQLRVMRAWFIPGGRTPNEKMPNKEQTLLAAINEIETLQSRVKELEEMYDQLLTTNRQLSAQQSAEPVELSDNYIGWAHYRNGNGDNTFLKICDSDSRGAFKIYRRAAIQSLPEVKS